MKFGKNVYRDYLNEVPKTHNFYTIIFVPVASNKSPKNRRAPGQQWQHQFTNAQFKQSSPAFYNICKFQYSQLQNSNWLISVYGLWGVQHSKTVSNQRQVSNAFCIPFLKSCSSAYVLWHDSNENLLSCSPTYQQKVRNGKF